MSMQFIQYEPDEPKANPLYPPMVYVHKQDQWEYYQLVRDLQAGEEPPTDEELNEIGKEGWELCGVMSHAEKVHFYFKRLVN